MKSKIIENGIVYNSSKKEILGYTKDIPNNLTIPDSVTSIGDYAFYNCNNLVKTGHFKATNGNRHTKQHMMHYTKV